MQWRSLHYMEWIIVSKHKYLTALVPQWMRLKNKFVIPYSIQLCDRIPTTLRSALRQPQASSLFHVSRAPWHCWVHCESSHQLRFGLVEASHFGDQNDELHQNFRLLWNFSRTSIYDIPFLIPSAPSMSVPAGNRTLPLILLNSETLSDSSRKTENTLDNLPIAKTLFLMICRRASRSSGVIVLGVVSWGAFAVIDSNSISSSNSSLEQIFNIDISISVTTWVRESFRNGQYFSRQQMEDSMRTLHISKLCIAKGKYRPWNLEANTDEECSWTA